MSTATQTINFDPRKITDLSQVLFENKKVIILISEKEKMSIEKAELLFSDTLRFLYLCCISEKSLSPNSMLDLGWHHFILSTREYSTFCKKYFGHFIHHSPFTMEDKQSLVSNPYKETFALANTVFTELSENWNNQISADCCDGGDCSNSEGGCSHCK